MRNALILSVEGMTTRIDLDAAPPSLSTLQNAVEGTIALIDLSPALSMYINDEGKYTHPQNDKATKMFRGAYRGTVDFIAGPVVFVGTVDDDGDDLGLTDKQLSILEFMLS